ncbi:MAG: hypothetical protein ACRDJH_11730 [Thermomicrobiales bacterium]
MATTKTVQIPADSELSRLLRDAVADDVTLLIAAGEETFRLEVAQEFGEGGAFASRRRPTPEDAADSRAAIYEAAGSWKDVDAEAFKAYITERRRTANRLSTKL